MMIDHRWTIFFLLFATTKILGFQCPQGHEACSCQPNHNDIEFYCQGENDSAYIVNVIPEDYVQIMCRNWVRWTDFQLNDAHFGKHLNSILFRMCGLPKDYSLANITYQIGVESVDSLLFQSFANLSNELTRQHLQGFPMVKKLVLSSNGFSSFPTDIFVDLPNLTWLDLRENNLRLPAGIFDGNPQLQLLELGNNAITTIEPDTFDQLKNLKFLNIWKNRLIEILPGTFDNLTSLRSLDISSNSLTNLPASIFKKLEKLETLHLFGNNFTSLPGDLLKNNTELRVVKLYNNKQNFTTFPNGFFANLTKLESVRLKRIGLATLPEDIFWGASMLANISLERNFLVTLPKEIFKGLKNLKTLELNFNILETLPDGIFSHANQLAKLDLSKNRFVSVSRHLFDGLKSLVELNMEENRLKTIHGFGFVFLKNLRVARFSRNELTLNSSNAQFKDEYGTKSPFHTCASLEELHLAYNNISEIYSDWGINDIRLRLLDLKYNNLKSISVEDLQFLSNQINVDLTHNNISQLLFKDAEQMANSRIPRDVIIRIEHNPIRCDCSLYDFLRYLEGRMHSGVQNYFHVIPGNLTCKDPQWLEGIEITQLKSKSLKCTVEDDLVDKSICPTNCTCWERPENRAYLINCSNQDLSEIPSNIRVYENHQVELNLTGNKLMEMPSKELLERLNVTTLLLSSNNIAHVSLQELSKNLKVLELHNNNISILDPEVTEFFKNSTSLVKLTLHQNPWKCDCNAKDFLNFVQTRVVDMPELLQITCQGTDTLISEMTINEFCPVEAIMVVGISLAVALMGLLIGGIAAFYYRYQREIKVWLYAHQCCLWFVTEDELDKDKLYDAFISYSHKDEDFVVAKLVSELENGPRSFKLCLHFRDWLVGEWIPTQIARSVEDSRRTIVVLSPNFLESVWGRMEFRAAHQQALSEKRARVILILFGDIGSTEDLDPELKAYLSMNTYIKWGDPWFWEKLRYALPHPELTKGTIRKRIFENHHPCIQINAEKKELIYPLGVPETPPAVTTPPADTLKMFICDENETKEHPVNDSENESTKLNGNVKHFTAQSNDLIKNQSIIHKIQCTTV